MGGNSIPRGRSGRATRSNRRESRATNGNSNSSEPPGQERGAGQLRDAIAVMNSAALESIAAAGQTGQQVRNDVEENMPDAPNVLMMESSALPTTAGPANATTGSDASSNIVLDSDTVPRYPVYNNNRIYASPTVQAAGQTSISLTNGVGPLQHDRTRPTRAQGRGGAPLVPTSTEAVTRPHLMEGAFRFNDSSMDPPPSPYLAPPGVGLFDPHPAAGLRNEARTGSYDRERFGSSWNETFMNRQGQIAAEEERAINQAIRNLDRAVAQAGRPLESVANGFGQGEMEYGARLRNYSQIMESHLVDDPSVYMTGISAEADLAAIDGRGYFPRGEYNAGGASGHEAVGRHDHRNFSYHRDRPPRNGDAVHMREEDIAGLTQRRHAYEYKYREALAIKLELQTLRLSLDPISNNLREKAECAAQTTAALQQCETQAARWRSKAERIDQDIENLRRQATSQRGEDTTSARTSFTQAENRGYGGGNGEAARPIDYLPMEIMDRSQEIMQREDWRSGEGAARRDTAHGVGGSVVPNAGWRGRGYRAPTQDRERGIFPRRNPRNQDGS